MSTGRGILTLDEYVDLGMALEGGEPEDDNAAIAIVDNLGGDLNAIRNPQTGVPIFLDIAIVDDPVRLEWILQTFSPNVNIQLVGGHTILFYYDMALQSLAVLIRYGINVRHEGEHDAVSAVYYFATQNLVDHVEMCLENGAKLCHVEKALAYSGTCSAIHALVEKMRTRATRCYRACLYFFELRKEGTLPLDMARFIAQMVWATRRQAEWDGK